MAGQIHAGAGAEGEWADEAVRVVIGDRKVVLRRLPDASLDALVTDPPAGIAFRGQRWDTFPTRTRPAQHTFADGRARPGVANGQEHRRGSRDSFVAFMTEVMGECLRVLRPGAFGLVWAIPRTSHWTATALEEAGFEVHDVVHH